MLFNRDQLNENSERKLKSRTDSIDGEGRYLCGKELNLEGLKVRKPLFIRLEKSIDKIKSFRSLNIFK